MFISYANLAISVIDYTYSIILLMVEIGAIYLIVTAVLLVALEGCILVMIGFGRVTIG